MRELYLPWNEDNAPVMQGIADAAVAPYRGQAHPDLLENIESFVTDALFLVDELHPLLAAGWGLTLTERAPLPEAATVDWEAVDAAREKRAAAPPPDPGWVLIKQVLAEGDKYLVWPFDDAELTAAEAARPRMVAYIDGLVAAMLARAVQVRIAGAVAGVLRKAMSHLSVADRALLRLRFRDNLPMEEIGARVGCTAAEARRRCQQMLERLGAHGRRCCPKPVLH
jgi:DNA-directed RNA polymerase specialized sigma24 family protein